MFAQLLDLSLDCIPEALLAENTAQREVYVDGIMAIHAPVK